MTHDGLTKARQREETTVPPAPDLSVVICSLNGEAGVRRCLHALAAQTIRSRIEVVVVDDGSTDGTSDVARGNGAVVVRHVANRGLAAARNSGLHAAAAPIVAFLDDDCEPEPDWAQRLLAAYSGDAAAAWDGDRDYDYDGDAVWDDDGTYADDGADEDDAAHDDAGPAPSDGILGVGGPVQPAAGCLSGSEGSAVGCLSGLKSAVKGFMAGYLTRHNPLMPLELELAGSQRLPQRFLLYLRRQWTPARSGQRDVYSFAGANMSFRRKTLLELGGFDERFRFGGEEGDLCRRVGLTFPQGRLVFVPGAEVVHHFDATLRDTLRRSRAYGRGSARLYRKWPGQRPTIFPWPCLMLALLIGSVWSPILLAAVALAPQLLYPQAARSALTHRRLRYLLDAYVQLLQESASDAGFAEGLWLFRNLVPEPAIPTGAPNGQARAAPAGSRGSRLLTGPVRGFLTVNLVALVLLAVLVYAREAWAAQVVLVPLLLTVPGILLLRALRVPGATVAGFPVYVPCASLVVLLATGLTVDLIGPLVGVTAPLRPGPLLAGLEIVYLVLVAVSIRAPAATAIPWRSLPPARGLIPLVLPLAGAAGALRLNTGHGDGVALGALLGWVLLVMLAFVFAPRLSRPVLAIASYAAGLAMLWSFSLRGHLFYGFDIADEYYLMHQTVVTGIWHASQSGNAFGAMLSVTVLPAELHALTGVPDALVFSLVYPMLAALVPVAVFFLAGRVLSVRWAFAAAAFIPTQAVFDQQLPGIARQQIALVLFTALVAVLLETRLSRRVQLPLAALFAVALSLSHYTTTYVAISLIGAGLFLQWVASWFRPVPRLSMPFAIGFLAAALGALVWYGPVTHSASNVTQFVQTAEAEGLNLLPNQRQGGSIIANYLQGNTQSPITSQQYANQVRTQYAQEKPFVHPLLPQAAQARYALRDSSPPTPPVRWNLAYRLLSLGQVAAQQLIYLLAAVGAVLLLVRRKVPVTGRQVGLLTLATLGFLIAIRLSGTLAAFYNAERAFLQAMVLLNIPVFWCLQQLADRRVSFRPGKLGRRVSFRPGKLGRRVSFRLERRSRVLSAVVTTFSAALLALPFAGGSGMAGAVLGGGTATNLASSGNDYEQFYVTPPELASASWLGTQVRPGELVYADRYGQLPLISQTGISNGLMLDVTPQTLDRNAWVYASQTNVVDKRARADFGDHNVIYVFPAGFLNDYYNLVFTDGSSEVYHG